MQGKPAFHGFGHRIVASFLGVCLTFMGGMSPMHADTTSAPAPPLPLAGSPADPLMGDTREEALGARISEINGEVFVKRPGAADFESVKKRSPLGEQDTVKTERGSCRIVFNRKADLVIGPKTILTIDRASHDLAAKTDTTMLLLQEGRLQVNLAKLKKGSSFEVKTPTAVAVVRGTVFYLTVGAINSVLASQLYVDESDGGVLFRNSGNGQSVLVPSFAMADALATGELTEPKPMSQEERNAFVEAWQKQLEPSAQSQQFGIEEVALYPGVLPPGGLLPDPLKNNLPAGAFSDALQDKLSEQNIPGANGLTTEEVQAPPEVPAPSQEDAAAAQETQLLREEIARLSSDIDFERTDANLAQVADSQTGKVFTDVHGKRVRVDQYIFISPPQPDPFPQTVSFLSLTARAGEYQNGVTALLFNTFFNRNIGPEDGPLRDLPWNDYLRVVRTEDLGPTELSPFFDQFIVHEHAEGQPDLFPLGFSLSLFNPIRAGGGQDFVTFSEVYSPLIDPDAWGGEYWIQARIGESVLIQQFGGDTVTATSTTPSGPDLFTVTVNGEPFQKSNDNSSGRQTAAFASDLPHIADLDSAAGINYYRDLPVNETDDFANHVHPAFFEEHYGTNRMLIGAFLPIDDLGQVINAPGFTLHGIRDVVRPNPLVNGGNYNLELLLAYGLENPDGTFSESFRIDALVRPELFSSYGSKNPDLSLDTSTDFPASLTPETDHDD